jgi:hypothetical protein
MMRKEMKYYGGISAGVLVFFLAISGIIFVISKEIGLFYVDIIASVFFSILVPVAFLLTRSQIKTDRVHAAKVLRRAFGGALSSNSYFEFLHRKYYSGISYPESEDAVPRHRGAAFARRVDWLLLASSLPFIILTGAGFLIIALPEQGIASLFSIYIDKIDSAETGTAAHIQKHYENIITLASLAFVSSYLYSIRLFFKLLAAYKPVSIVMLRAFAHMLFSVLLAVMIWRVAPESEPFTNIATKVQNSIDGGNKSTARPSRDDIREQQAGASPNQRGQIPEIWLVLAFAIGFIPDAAFSWLLRQTRLRLNRRHAKAANHAAATPLTIIDGIDFAAAFALEEGGIANVQNLATANPIMLHVETAYCIFPIMDWIGQAQLCAAAGPERFLLFRTINIRTIFDLERAVLDNESPAGLKQIAGAILLAHGTAKTSLLRDFGVRPLDVVHRDFDKALTAWVNIEVVEHLVRVIMDSLYIHRFRLLWCDIEASLTPPEAVKPQRTAPKFVTAAPSQSNGGSRDMHSVDIAGSGKPGLRENRTEIQGD